MGRRSVYRLKTHPTSHVHERTQTKNSEQPAFQKLSVNGEQINMATFEDSEAAFLKQFESLTDRYKISKQGDIATLQSEDWSTAKSETKTEVSSSVTTKASTVSTKKAQMNVSIKRGVSDSEKQNTEMYNEWMAKVEERQKRRDSK